MNSALRRALLGHMSEHLESRHACDRGVLELQVIGQLRETGVEGLLERRQRQVLALRIAAVPRGRQRLGRRGGIGDRSLHDLEGAGIRGARPGVASPGKPGSQRRAAGHILIAPLCACPACVACSWKRAGSESISETAPCASLKSA